MPKRHALISTELGSRHVSRAVAARRLRRMRKLCGNPEICRHSRGQWTNYIVRGNGGLTFAVQTVRS
jgi:hypothetical protein